jgi:serine/threonine protein kinase
MLSSKWTQKQIHRKHFWIAPWESSKKEKALKEFAIQKKLGRPYAPKVFKLKKRPFLWSLEQEKLKGPFLDQILRDGKTLPLCPREVTQQTLRILERLHCKDLVHGDLAPEHIALCARHKKKKPFVSLIDFGTSAHELLRPKIGWAPEGKIRYASPARLQGAPSVPADDLFSLSVIAYEMVFRSPWTPYPERKLCLADRQRYLLQRIQELLEDEDCPKWVKKGFYLSLSLGARATDWMDTHKDRCFRAAKIHAK